MDPAAIPVAELLPHGPRMIVIDRLVAHDRSRTVAVATVRPDSLFFERTGVPAWAGIEYMAQTVAAHAGVEARRLGERPAVGFLLGTRSYVCHVAEFPLGAELTITVEPLLAENALASFRCRIERETLAAEADISIYRPSGEELARLDAGRARS